MARCNECVHCGVCINYVNYTDKELVDIECYYYETRDEIKEVVHGRWKIKNTEYGDCMICSNCGSEAYNNFNYCPYCGAKMG